MAIESEVPYLLTALKVLEQLCRVRSMLDLFSASYKLDSYHAR